MPSPCSSFCLLMKTLKLGLTLQSLLMFVPTLSLLRLSPVTQAAPLAKELAREAPLLLMPKSYTCLLITLVTITLSSKKSSIPSLPQHLPRLEWKLCLRGVNKGSTSSASVPEADTVLTKLERCARAHCVVQHHTMLHNTAQHCATLHNIAQCHTMLLCDILPVWCIFSLDHLVCCLVWDSLVTTHW